jgi:hypothetical protein
MKYTNKTAIWQFIQKIHILYRIISNEKLFEKKYSLILTFGDTVDVDL